MKTIAPTDILFARINSLGREIANLRLSGFTSVGQALTSLRDYIGDNCGRGAVSLELRNSSQGWVDRRAMLL